MAKAVIVNAMINNEDVIVEYASGAIKKYLLDKMPQTVRAFLDQVDAIGQELELPVKVGKAEIAPILDIETSGNVNIHAQTPIESIIKGIEVIAPIAEDMALAAIVAIEKAFEVATPVVARAVVSLTRLIARGVCAILPIIWMTILDIFDALAFWIPELLQRAGFVLAWRVWPEMVHIFKAIKKMIIIACNGLVAQWLWAEELKSELRCDDEIDW